MICQDKSINVNKFHEMMGHCGTERLQKTANILGFKLIGNIEVCQDCALAEERQKNISKEWKGGSQVPGEIIDLDINSVRDLSLGGAKCWVLVVDDHHTDYC
jgi:hypothetical protein